MGKQSIFYFTDVDLVLIKGRSAKWDGGVHLHQNFTEITSRRSCCSPPAARVDRGSRGSVPCLPACLLWCHSAKPSQTSRRAGQAEGLWGLQKQLQGCWWLSPGHCSILGMWLSPWAGAEPQVKVKRGRVKDLRKWKMSPIARRELRRYCQSKVYH